MGLIFTLCDRYVPQGHLKEGMQISHTGLKPRHDFWRLLFFIRECVSMNLPWDFIPKALWREQSCDNGLHLKPSKRFFPFHGCFTLMPWFHDNEKATITFVLSILEVLRVTDTEGNLIRSVLWWDFAASPAVMAPTYRREELVAARGNVRLGGSPL